MTYKVMFTFKRFLAASKLEIHRNHYCTTNNESLVLLHVVFRHGNRAPEKHLSYANDPHRDLSYFPNGWGQLTNKGKEAVFNLGLFIRKRYDKFLGDYYVPEMLEAWATDFNRTKLSLHLFLAGVFPPKHEQIWNSDFNWQPIPYRYSRIFEDRLLQANSSCPEYLAAYKSYQESSGISKKYKDLFKYLSEQTGFEITTTKHVWEVAVYLKIQEEFGLDLPPWTKSVWPKPIEGIAEYEYIFNSATPRLMELAIGKFMRKLVADTKNNIDQQSQVKMYVYSGHEINVGNVLRGLNLFEPHIPEYTSCVIIEVHKHLADHSVKVYYKPRADSQLQLLKMKGQEEYPFEGFVDVIESGFKLVSK